MKTQEEEIQAIRKAMKHTLVIVACSLVCVACGLIAVVAVEGPLFVAVLATIGVWQLLVGVKETLAWVDLWRLLRVAETKWDVYCLARGRRP